MESNGSYGSKIQTLVRHLLHIQLVDSGAKSIVFSAWADSLASEFVVSALHVTFPPNYVPKSSSTLFIQMVSRKLRGHACTY